MANGGFMPRSVQLLGLLFAAATAACARPGSLDTSGPFDIDRAPSDGLRYYVTRDLISIDAKTISRHTAARGLGGECTPRDSIATSWTVTATTTPDRRQAYRLGLAPSSTMEQALGVKLSETGVLTSLNYSGADERAAIVSSIAKGAAGILGTVTTGGLTAGKDTSCAQISKVRARLDSTTHVLRTFDVTELPSATGSNMSWADVSHALTAYPRAAELFGVTNIVLSVSPLPDPATPLEPAPGAKGLSMGCSGSDSVCARIYFREPIMRVIRIHVPSEMDVKRATFTIREERIVPLVAANDPILNLSFGTQTLGSGKITLTFGPHGNVTGVQQTSSAALADAAKSAAAAELSARGAYMSALRAQIERLDLEIKAVRDDAALRKAQAADTAIGTP
jgi:hypothetical protein